jgi:hypothetical protein
MRPWIDGGQGVYTIMGGSDGIDVVQAPAPWPHRAVGEKQPDAAQRVRLAQGDIVIIHWH